jgi:DNA-binding NtrC family response regulator
MNATSTFSMVRAPDLILLDMDMEGVDTLEAIRTCREMHPGQKVVALSFVCDAHAVAETIRAGALDYLVKPFDEARITALFKQHLSNGMVTAHPQATLLPRVPNGSQCTDGHYEDLGNGSFFVAASACMQQMRSQIALIARVDVPVLVLGESGVGKEIAVRLIHKMSQRSTKPLLKVNCAAFPPNFWKASCSATKPAPLPGRYDRNPVNLSFAKRALSSWTR